MISEEKRQAQLAVRKAEKEVRLASAALQQHKRRTLQHRALWLLTPTAIIILLTLKVFWLALLLLIIGVTLLLAPTEHHPHRQTLGRAGLEEQLLDAEFNLTDANDTLLHIILKENL